MHHRVSPPIVFTQFVNLGMTIMTAGDAVIRSRCLDLLVFQLSIFETLLLETGLKKTAAAPAAVIIGSVGLHIDKVFFTHNRLNHISKVFGNGITITFTNDLARVLNRKLDFKFFVPVGTDF